MLCKNYRIKISDLEDEKSCHIIGNIKQIIDLIWVNDKEQAIHTSTCVIGLHKPGPLSIHYI